MHMNGMFLAGLLVATILSRAPATVQSKAPPAALSLFVADLPAKYIMGWRGHEEILGYKTNGTEEKVEVLLEDTDWRCGGNWIAHQLETSLLRTDNVNDADLVYVPVNMRYWAGCVVSQYWEHDWEVFAERIHSFMHDAPTLLPELGKRPHLIVLHMTASIYSSETVLFRHENTKLFTFITHGPWVPAPVNSIVAGNQPSSSPSTSDVAAVQGIKSSTALRESNCPWCVGAVYYQNKHWNTSSGEYQGSQLPLNRSSACGDKSQLVAQAFVVRKAWNKHVKDNGYVEGKDHEVDQRTILARQCASRRADCLHINWESYNKSAEKVAAGFRNAWYTFHPLGDNIIRGAMFDAMLAHTIPVVFNREVAWQLPFTDVIDYSKLILYVPLEDLLHGPTASKNVIDLINDQFSFASACDQLQAVHQVRPVFQYLRDPNHELITFNGRFVISPGDDAFTFTMKGVLRHLCRTKNISFTRCDGDL